MSRGMQIFLEVNTNTSADNESIDSLFGQKYNNEISFDYVYCEDEC